MINSFTYNGKNTEELGLYVGGQHTFGAPQRDVTKVAIPGRNGDLVRDNGRFLNSEIMYNIVAMNEFTESAKNVRNWLMRSSGYHRLEDTYDPDHYRMARVAGTVDFETGAYNATGKTQVTFDCMPQRFLKSGETVVSGDPVEKSASGEIASFETDYAVPMTSAEVSLSPQQDLNGYDSPWPEGGGKNKFDVSKLVNTADITVNNGAISVTGNAKNSTKKLSELADLVVGSTYTLTATVTGGTSSLIYLYGSNYSWTYGTQRTITQQDLDSLVFFYGGSGTTAVLTEMMIRLSSVTDATFAPYSNICPISGHSGAELIRTGKNLLDDEERTLLYNAIYFGGATGADSGDVITLPPGTYTFSVINTDGSVTSLYAKDADASTNVSGFPVYNVNSKTFTLTERKRIRFWAYKASYSSVDDVKTAQLELGSSATAYEPYQGNTYSVTFTDQGTVYGGTVDLVSGKLKVTRKTITLDGSQPINPSQNNRFYVTISDAAIVNASNQTTYQGVISEILPTTSWAGLGYSDGCSPVWGHGVAFKSALYTSASEWTTYFTNNPTVFSYELATPLEYTLSAQQIETLLGENNVWSDAGEISLTFYEPAELDNPTLFDSKPLIRAYGSGDGQVTIGNQIIALTDIDDYIDIDCEAMDCYNGVENCNSKVTLGAQGFPTLPPGITAVSFGGGVTRVEITPRWWEL